MRMCGERRRGTGGEFFFGGWSELIIFVLHTINLIVKQILSSVGEGGLDKTHTTKSINRSCRWRMSSAYDPFRPEGISKQVTATEESKGAWVKCLNKEDGYIEMDLGVILGQLFGKLCVPEYLIDLALDIFPALTEEGVQRGCFKALKDGGMSRDHFFAGQEKCVAQYLADLFMDSGIVGAQCIVQVGRVRVALKQNNPNQRMENNPNRVELFSWIQGLEKHLEGRAFQNSTYGPLGMIRRLQIVFVRDRLEQNLWYHDHDSESQQLLLRVRERLDTYLRDNPGFTPDSMDKSIFGNHLHISLRSVFELLTRDFGGGGGGRCMSTKRRRTGDVGAGAAHEAAARARLVAAVAAQGAAAQGAAAAAAAQRAQVAAAQAKAKALLKTAADARIDANERLSVARRGQLSAFVDEERLFTKFGSVVNYNPSASKLLYGDNVHSVGSIVLVGDKTFIVCHLNRYLDVTAYFNADRTLCYNPVVVLASVARHVYHQPRPSRPQLQSFDYCVGLKLENGPSRGWEIEKRVSSVLLKFDLTRITARAIGVLVHELQAAMRAV